MAIREINKCFETVHAPAGQFQMGDKNISDAQPVHPVQLSEFWPDKYEFTNGAFDRAFGPEHKFFEVIKTCNGVPSSIFTLDPQTAQAAKKNEKKCNVEVKTWEKPKSQPGFEGPDQPLINVNWFLADAICRALDKKLPTEAQQEYLIRGGSAQKNFATPNGELTDDQGNKQAHVSIKNAPDLTTTATVGKYSAGTFGTYDSTGNAWEWSATWYAFNEGYTNQAKGSEPVNDPQGPASGGRLSVKAIRGGGFRGYNPIYLSAGVRTNNEQGHSSDELGFRCVSTSPPPVCGDKK